MSVGLIIYIPLSFYLPARITSQILKRDLKIAEYIARQIREPFLTGDELALVLLLHENRKNLDDAEYIFVQNRRGKIVAHTFEQGFPVDLLNISRDRYGIMRFVVEGRDFYDLSVPVLEGGQDRLHLGISFKSGEKEVAEFSRINYYVAGAIFAGLGLGFLALLVLGVRESKRLSSLEERNKLAVELHDGLAQSLANVVIRLELCQKLFDTDQKQALDELNKLKDNARELVKSAREAISKLRGT